VSGRTEKGLGVGFLNAITEKTYATIENVATGETRKEVIEPLVNYNVLVFDQRFNQNSSVTFVNTNTIRDGEFRDANVSALLFDLNTKANTYNLFGDFKYSTVKDVDYINDYSYGSKFGLENYDGFKTQLSFAKTSGKYRYLFSGKYLSKHYDVNDLGIIFVNNYHSGYGEMTYRIINPTKTFNTFKFNQNINVEIENTTGKTQTAWYKAVMTAATLKNHYIEGLFQVNPLNRYDFYEPRVYGRYVFIPKSIIGYAQFYSNDNRAFHYELELASELFDEEGRNVYKVFGGLKYRFSDRFSLSYNFQYTRKVNDRGWVDFDGDDIVFAERNREIVDHYFTGKYSITDKMTFNLIARYYWSYAENHEFFNLQDDGSLMPNLAYSKNKNRNFNSWNFDFSYSWWFAPGSELSLLYRNYALESTNLVQKDFQTNLENVFDTNLTSILSISLRYYIDYNSLKRKR
jgi:hypothetical protein